MTYICLQRFVDINYIKQLYIVKPLFYHTERCSYHFLPKLSKKIKANSTMIFSFLSFFSSIQTRGKYIFSPFSPLSFSFLQNSFDSNNALNVCKCIKCEGFFYKRGERSKFWPYNYI